MSAAPDNGADAGGDTPSRPAHSYVYLHGLNGSSRSLKAGLLRRALAPAPLLAPDYPAHRAGEAVRELTTALRAAGAGGPLTLIGSSMGGFYGQYLARQLPTAHLFLINPALDAVGLWRALPRGTMVSGQDEPYRLREPDIAALAPYVIADPCAAPVPTTLFLDEGDELIDWRIAATHYARCGRVHHWAGGNHAFAHLDAAVAIMRATLHSRDL